MAEIISKKLMGHRVKMAREQRGWTQNKLKEALSLNDRQTISDMEQGKRALKPGELIALTELLDLDMEFFLDPFSVLGEAQFSWKASPELAQESLNEFEVKASKWVGLLRWLRVINQIGAKPLKYSLCLSTKSTFEDAIICADHLAESLELGLIPAEHLSETIEQKLDIPILFVDTIETPNYHSISGATCHLENLSVILINRHEPEARRFFNLTHELFHTLTWDAIKPPYREPNSLEGYSQHKSKRIEQLADNFAAGLLMPLKSLKQLIVKEKFSDIDHLLTVALQLKVTPTALAWRLYHLKLIDDKIRLLLSDQKQQTTVSESIKRFSHNFMSMLYQAIHQGCLSARKAAKTLNMNLAELENLFAEYSIEFPFEL